MQFIDGDFKFWKTVFKMHEYDGLDIVMTRDKIWAMAKRIEDGSEKRLIMFVIGIYVQVGTNWSDPKKAGSMKKGARDLIKLVQRTFKLDTRLTDANKRDALTIGRFVAAYPELVASAYCMKDARTVVQKEELTGGNELPQYLMFPAARSLIPMKTENPIYKKYGDWHTDFSNKFNERINAGRAMGSRSKNQQQYLDNAWKSPLFKDDTRELILKQLEGTFAKIGKTDYVASEKLSFTNLEVNV
jgi:hypothetical protein